MIKQRLMGRTGLKISELCLGTLNFGWKTDDRIAFAILDAYHAAGGNFIQATHQSPELFLPSATVAASEEIVGRWWTTRKLRRQDLFLATRVYLRAPADAADGTLTKLASDACREALRRMQTNYLDLVIFEWSEGFASLREPLAAFDHVVRRGLTRYVGAGSFPTWRVSDSLARAYLRNHARFEALQADYSLMTRARFELEAMALCQEQRLGFFARSPLAGGFLTRRFDLETIFHSGRRDWLMERYGNTYGEAAQTATAEVAQRHEASSAQIALSWVLHNPAVTSAVIGVHSVAQLHELVRATSLALSADDLAHLDHATAAEEIRLTPEVARADVPRRAWMLA